MDVCPHCRRRLLSHISTRCNWCGTEITDAAYLAQAEVERATSRAEDALHSLQSLTINPLTQRYSYFNQASALLGLPLLTGQDDIPTFARAEYESWEYARQAAVVRAQQQKRSLEAQAEETPVKEPAAETPDRFKHLEL